MDASIGGAPARYIILKRGRRVALESMRRIVPEIWSWTQSLRGIVHE